MRKKKRMPKHPLWLIMKKFACLRIPKDRFRKYEVYL